MPESIRQRLKPGSSEECSRWNGTTKEKIFRRYRRKKNSVEHTNEERTKSVTGILRWTDGRYIEAQTVIVVYVYLKKLGKWSEDDAPGQSSGGLRVYYSKVSVIIIVVLSSCWGKHFIAFIIILLLSFQFQPLFCNTITCNIFV